MKVQIMERKTWEKVSRATEMENSMTYVLKYTEKGHSASTYTFTQPLLSNG
jgi:dihydrofolate reductase